MATTLVNPELVFATNNAILSARPDLAKIKQFCVNFSAEAAEKGQTFKIPLFRAGPASIFNASTNNYENAEGSVWWVDMKFDIHLKHTWNFNEKHTLITALDVFRYAGIEGGRAIAQALVERTMGEIRRSTVKTSGKDPNAVFGEDTVINGTEYARGDFLPNAPEFSADNEVVFTTETTSGKKKYKGLKNEIAHLRDAAHRVGINPRNSVLALNSNAFSELLSLLDSNIYGGSEAVRGGVIPNLFGWKSVMECNEFRSGEHLVGAVIPEDAIAIAGRRIEVGSPSIYDEVGTTTDNDTGLVLGTRSHGTPQNGEKYATIEALFGVKLLQPTKIIRLVDEATDEDEDSGDASEGDENANV